VALQRGGRLLELWGWELVERDCVLNVGREERNSFVVYVYRGFF
jgi:hypothetical protein